MLAHILIIEDDPAVAASTETTLQLMRKEFRTTIIPNSSEAMDFIDDHAHNIDLIILDLDLEQKGIGLAVLSRAAKIPVVVVTGRSGKDEDAKSALRAGAVAFFSKPAEPRELASLVKNQLELRGAFDKRFQFPGCEYDSKEGKIYKKEGIPLIIKDVSKEVFDLLAKNYPKSVPSDIFIKEVYGGLNDQKDSFYKTISRLKKTLSAHKMPITISSVRGRYTGGYELVPLSDEDNEG
jgi:DNA-binding response OmpR family regulator